MLDFLKQNAYNMVKLLVDQLAFTVFGTMLAIATYESSELLLATSIFSILFYLYVIYAACWEIGAKDKIKIDGGRMRPFPSKGLLIALGANVPNLLLGILMGAGIIIGAAWSHKMSFICNAIARLAEGMYLGVIKVLSDVTGGAIADIWWWFIVITLPAICTGGLAYYMGSTNRRIGAVFGIKVKPERHE